jgi:hypothetical protein
VGADHVRAQRLTKLRDIALEHVARRRWRLLVPDGVDQALGRHHLARVQEEDRQHRPLRHPTELNQIAVAERLDRSEDAEVDAHWRPR